MKKVLLVVCVLAIVSPVFSAENSSSVQYMNQSEGFAGFNKSLPQASSFKNLEKPTKVTKERPKDNFLDEFGDDGFRIEKPVSTERKVIKTMKDNGGKPSNKYNPNDKPMTYDNFPKSFDDANNQMMMPIGVPGMF